MYNILFYILYIVEASGRASTLNISGRNRQKQDANHAHNGGKTGKLEGGEFGVD